MAMAQDKPAVVSEYLPVTDLKAANMVSVQLDDSVQPYLKMLDEAFNKLDAKDRADILSTVVPGRPIGFDKRLGISKADYDAYLAAWNKKQIINVAPVAVSLMQEEGERGLWKLVALTQQGPLPLSTLKYDPAKNVWVSPNGELTFKSKVQYDSSFAYGAWQGREWALETKTPTSTVKESLQLGKSDDGKSVLIMYLRQDTDMSGAQTMNQPITLMLPVAALNSSAASDSKGASDSKPADNKLKKPGKR